MNFADLVSVARFDRETTVDSAFGRRKQLVGDNHAWRVIGIAERIGDERNDIVDPIGRPDRGSWMLRMLLLQLIQPHIMLHLEVRQRVYLIIRAVNPNTVAFRSDHPIERHQQMPRAKQAAVFDHQMSGFIGIAVQHYAFNAPDIMASALDCGSNINFEHNSPPLTVEPKLLLPMSAGLSNPDIGLMGLIRLMGRQSRYLLVSLSPCLLVSLSPCLLLSLSLCLFLSSSLRPSVPPSFSVAVFGAFFVIVILDGAHECAAHGRGHSRTGAAH